MEPITIVIFSDYLCPFCFLAKEIMKRIQKTQSVKVIWRPFDLHPTRLMMPPMDSPYIKKAWVNVQRLANENNIEIHLPEHLSLTRKALETAEYARARGLFEVCHERIFNAYFLEGKDIEAEGVLLQIIKDLGLDPRELKHAWNEETFYQIIKDSTHELNSIGITEVPTFIIGNEKQRILIGVHSQEHLEKVIKNARNDLIETTKAM